MNTGEVCISVLFICIAVGYPCQAPLWWKYQPQGLWLPCFALWFVLTVIHGSRRAVENGEGLGGICLAVSAMRKSAIKNRKVKVEQVVPTMRNGVRVGVGIGDGGGGDVVGDAAEVVEMVVGLEDTPVDTGMLVGVLSSAGLSGFVRVVSRFHSKAFVRSLVSVEWG